MNALRVRREKAGLSSGCKPHPATFETYDDIIDIACDAWRKLIAQPAMITSIGMRD
jgi:hypothetical protein